ncbi:hypothetical protein DYB32_008205, partial [Aphanomyces invadans]
MTDPPQLSPRRPEAKVGRIHPCPPDTNVCDVNDVIGATDDVTESHKADGMTFKATAQTFARPDNDTWDAGGVPDMSTTDQVEAMCGLGYVVFTLVLTMSYLTLLAPVMANDLWWSGFNSTGAQSYIIDAMNDKLIVATTESIDLTASTMGRPTDYSTFYSPIHIASTYTRMVVDSESANLTSAIASLQFVWSPDSIPTQFCWVDFNKTWEVAHTGPRQARCYVRYTANAAVYWETTIRMSDWNTWMTAKEAQFNVTLGNAMRRTPAGDEWIRRSANAFKDVPSEVEVWKGAGLTHFTLQYANVFAWGIEERIHIQNAFGGSQAISIKSSSVKSLGAQWTTLILCWGPWNDLTVGASVEYSLVRNDPHNQRFTSPCSYDDYLANPDTYDCDPCKAPWNPIPGDCWPDFELFFAFPALPGIELVSSNIGPFGSIDLYLVATPPSLKTLASTYQAALAVLAPTNDAFKSALHKIPGYEADPVPLAWSSEPYLYMGGDPSCPFRDPMPFVQSSFAFDMSCTTQERHRMLLNAFNSIFALLASSPAPSAATICAQCPTMAHECTAVVTPAATAAKAFRDAYAMHDEWVGQINAARDDVVKLGVGTMQLAIHATDETNAFLFQTLLSSTPSSWDFFG